jgi:hypothetical protein
LLQRQGFISIHPVRKQVYTVNLITKETTTRLHEGTLSPSCYIQFLALKQNLGDTNLNIIARWEELRQDGWCQLTPAAFSREHTGSFHDA